MTAITIQRADLIHLRTLLRSQPFNAHTEVAKDKNSIRFELEGGIFCTAAQSSKGLSVSIQGKASCSDKTELLEFYLSCLSTHQQSGDHENNPSQDD